ncbi:MAG: hypothetical protein ACI4DP_09920 [Candidatus Ornithomonoglobus sp.]
MEKIDIHSEPEISSRFSGLGKKKSFYSDYIIFVNGETRIVVTKGGFNRAGKSIFGQACLNGRFCL